MLVIDVSGSMNGPDRLGLAKQSLKLLVENLRLDDTVALVTYAGSTQVVLPATPIAQRDRIRHALDQLATNRADECADRRCLVTARDAHRHRLTFLGGGHRLDRAGRELEPTHAHPASPLLRSLTACSCTA